LKGTVGSVAGSASAQRDKLDPDPLPHQRDKLDPDPHPHQSDKLDLDPDLYPHQFADPKSKCMENEPIRALFKFLSLYLEASFGSGTASK
jgi:hypothetical protein